MKTENETYKYLLSSNLNDIIERLRAIPPDKWDWAPAPAAPSPRIVAEHAWAWMVCDRQHLTEPDTTRHSLVPTAPATIEALCEALESEKHAWTEMMAALSPQQFAEVRYHFGSWPMNVRELVAHIVQLVTYKSGQLSTLFFALGLDGDDPYTAPHPNDHYTVQNGIMAQPLHAAILRSDPNALSDRLTTDEKLINLSVADLTPLQLAVFRNSADIVSLLLQHGADCDQRSSEDDTALITAAFLGHTDIAKMLIDHGADVNVRNKWSQSPLDLALTHKHAEVADLLVAAGARTQ